MQNVTTINLSQSGFPLLVPNELRDSASLSVTYTVNGNPASLSVSVSGMKNSQETQVLDTYSGTSNASRTINLTDTYTAFRFVAVWQGGQNVSVAASVTSSGSGPVFDSTLLPAQQSYSVS